MGIARTVTTATLVALLLGAGQLACNHPGGPENSAQVVGTPCTPTPESSEGFHGFKITEDTIETGSPECGTGVCLVNHFQGRVSCPLGQAAPKDAQGHEGCVPETDAQGHFTGAQGSCADGFACIVAGSVSPICDHTEGAAADMHCLSLGAGSKCGAGDVCECSSTADCAGVTDAVVACDPETKQCVQFACHKPGNCQDPAASPEENAGKECCQPGTDLPVTTPVCGQCTGDGNTSSRDAESAVYCTCRCGVADGAPDEPDYPFCACPDGFECSELRKNVGLGDPEVTGKFCIKQGTAYDANTEQCGLVDGFWTAGGYGNLKCSGIGSGQCQSADGPCN